MFIVEHCKTYGQLDFHCKSLQNLRKTVTFYDNHAKTYGKTISQTFGKLIILMKIIAKASEKSHIFI